MNINPKELMFGQPILKIREVIRLSMSNKCFDTKSELIEKVANILKVSKAKSKKVFDQLIKEEYFVFIDEKNRQFCYLSETPKGMRLGIANAIPPISRNKADQLLKDVIKRAEDINSNDNLVYFVEQLNVFGSYLSDKETLGDLDVGVKISRKKQGDEFMEHNYKRIDEVIANGKHFKSYVEKLFYPYREIELRLKNKQRSLSLHDLETDGVFNHTETRLVYQYDGKV